MLWQHFYQMARSQRIGHQRQAGNGQALPGQGGLHNLVRVVEVQPARWLQLIAVVGGKPALPAQPLQLGLATMTSSSPNSDWADASLTLAL